MQFQNLENNSRFAIAATDTVDLSTVTEADLLEAIRSIYKNQTDVLTGLLLTCYIRLLSHFVLSIHCIYFHSFPLIYEKYHLEGKMICALALEMVNLFEEMIVLWMVFKINQEIHDKQLSRIWCFCNIR